MIVTLTLNPSLDRTVDVESLERGAVNRTSDPVLEPGGKGVNVTRALIANGVPSLAVLAVGGPEGAELSRLLERDGVLSRFVPVSGRTRSNLTVCEPDGTVTKLNEPGNPLTASDVNAIATAMRTSTRDGDWLVVSGSTPPRFTTAQVQSLLAEATATGAQLVIDSSGEMLAMALEAAPRIVKPNRHELAELVGRPLGSMAEVREAAEQVRARGAEHVLVSLGAEGAVLVGPAGMLVGESRVTHPRSTVGAGDCFLAGFLSRFTHDEADVEAALLEALTWGAAATRLPGSAVPGPADLDPSIVQLVWQPDLDRPLVAS
ncbi:MAG TPA: 1-phosphofructokinase family hexose kinase [Pseudolysinimonas sp.]|nr:1-phosphofructokinase family hexose kinase [Pseudolysinimonas sp.]